MLLYCAGIKLGLNWCCADRTWFICMRNYSRLKRFQILHTIALLRSNSHVFSTFMRILLARIQMHRLFKTSFFLFSVPNVRYSMCVYSDMFSFSVLFVQLLLFAHFQNIYFSAPFVCVFGVMQWARKGENVFRAIFSLYFVSFVVCFFLSCGGNFHFKFILSPSILCWSWIEVRYCGDTRLPVVFGRLDYRSRHYCCLWILFVLLLFMLCSVVIYIETINWE